jgi:di/tricarboxylate transporter
VQIDVRLFAALGIDPVVSTMDVPLLVVLGILAVTVFLIVTEWIRIDVIAIMAMLALVWTGSISAEQARSGFSSNAVWAIIGVMIMGRGLYSSGVTETMANFILRMAGRSRSRILSTISLTVGAMSGFIQNIGAAALFLPVMMGISKREKIPVSGLLMPMGFAALLGGTLTMVGTSSLIILNDLLSAQGLATFDLLSVTPIGIVLLLAGVAYFVLAGPFVLPNAHGDAGESSPGKRLLNVWGLSDSIYTYRIPRGSDLVGQSVEDSGMGARFNVNLLRVYRNGQDANIWEDVTFDAGQCIVVQGADEHVQELAETFDLRLTEETDRSAQGAQRGYLEVVIPARSDLVGKTVREVALRKTYNAQIVLYFSGGEVVDEAVADRKIRAGDTMVLEGDWDNLRHFEDSTDFLMVTPLERTPRHPDKIGWAVGSFAGAVGLVMAFDIPISIGFLTGALVMILAGVLSIEEAYRAVEWKVVFLISGLIPIGIAMETSGAAAFIAQGLVEVVEGVHPFVILLALGALTTFFSLIMSNVAATVLMVPLVLQLAGIGGLSSQVLALQVGICGANSFILPTHHVNALLMTPGGYRVSDYLRAGSGLTLLFIVLSSTMLYAFYL